MVLDREGDFTDFRAFDFHAYSNADDYLSEFLAEIADNAIVLIAVMDEAWWSGNAPESDKQAADQQLRSLGAKTPDHLNIVHHGPWLNIRDHTREWIGSDSQRPQECRGRQR